VGDAELAGEQLHVRHVEHVARQAVALVQADAVAVDGGDAGRVLATVLQHRQAVVEGRGDVAGAGDSDDAAHGLVSLPRVRGG